MPAHSTRPLIDPIVAARLSALTREVLERSRFAYPGTRPNLREAAREATAELRRRMSSDLPAELGRPISTEARKRVEAKWGPDAYEIEGGERRAVREGVSAAAGSAPRRPGAMKPRHVDRRAGKADANRRMLSRVAYELPAGRGMQLKVFDRLANLLECIEPGAGNRCRQLLIDQERLARWKNAHKASDWLEPAAPEEASALQREGKGPGSAWYDKRQSAIMDALLPGGPLSADHLGKIRKFRDDALAKGHERIRVDQSLRRFLAPFCAHARTGGIERGWHELSPAEQDAVIRHGLEVEKIWLGPRPSTLRIYHGFATQPKAKRTPRNRRAVSEPTG